MENAAAIRQGRIASFEEIAASEGHGERHIRLLAPLAFVSPRIIASMAPRLRISRSSASPKPCSTRGTSRSRASGSCNKDPSMLHHRCTLERHVALNTRCAALRTGLRRVSNRSSACRNGNWKITSRDWRL